MYEIGCGTSKINKNDLINSKFFYLCAMKRRKIKEMILKLLYEKRNNLDLN